MKRLLDRLFCLLGIHGPTSYGLHSTYRSQYLGPRLRKCCACKTTWLATAEDELMRPSQWKEVNT